MSLLYAIPVFFVIAFLYSMVGLGGGSAYAGFLTLFGINHKLVPSTALFLNIIVSLMGAFNYRIHFPFKDKKITILSLYLSAIVGTALGSKITLQKSEFYIILGSALILAGITSFIKERITQLKISINTWALTCISFLIGFVTGVVGIGGGIFLSPVLLLSGFPVKEVASITSLYILGNSSVGFVSHWQRGNVDWELIVGCGGAVMIGGFAGSYLGSFKFKPATLRNFLNAIIIIVGIQILWKGIS